MDKIICLGKNYNDHIIEMKDAAPERPVLFIKPPSTILEVKDKDKVRLPWARGEIHYECEIVFKLYKKNIIAVTLGLDLTLRDLQRTLKTNGHPWEVSKVFKNSSIITDWKAPRRDFPEWQTTAFEFKVNGELRQSTTINNANYKADAIIHYIDEFFPMHDGDLIFTGTPAGVGSLKIGDTIEMIWGPIHTTFSLVE